MYKIDGYKIIDKNGKVILFNIEGFEKIICAGDVCFICGSKRTEKPFNDEHILPQWLLKAHNLYNKSITLANKTTIYYSKYKIPCCEECNSLMGNKIEHPVQKLMDSGYHIVNEYIKSQGPWLLIIWLSLLFIKTHYKDIFLRLQRNSQAPPYKISDMYEWKQLYHIYCIARSFYSGAVIKPETLCSFILIPAKKIDGLAFDYCDLYDLQGSLIQHNDIALLMVHNDGCACIKIIEDTFKKIKGDLIPLQLRELFAILAYANQTLENRPEFISKIDMIKEKYEIVSKRPHIFKKSAWDSKVFGSLMLYLCEDLLEYYPKDTKEEVKNGIKSGQYTFLMNERGEFIQH